MIRRVEEAEIVAEFLKAEVNSPRFEKKIEEILKRLEIDKEVLIKPDVFNSQENRARELVLGEFRGYRKNFGLFENFPDKVVWYEATISPEELKKVKYIDWDFWVNVSEGSRLPVNGAKNLLNGKAGEVEGKKYLSALDFLERGGKFPRLILVARDKQSDLVVLEGHLRLTVYQMAVDYVPKNLPVFVGYSKKFRKWDLYGEERELREAIIKTIDYAKKYKTRLTPKQVWFRLFSGKKFSRKEVMTELKKMKVRLKKPEKRKIDDRKLEQAKNFCNEYLKKNTSIRLVGITGSVAAENSKKGEDIDFMLICKPGTLWWTRLKLWLHLNRKKIPHRKYGQAEKANEFCFNLWLEEDRLKLPHKKQGRKNAADLIMMKTIMDRGGVYDEFISKNQWAKKYVANGYGKISRIKNQVISIKPKTNIFLTLLNEAAFWIQISFIRLKGPINFIDKHRAFFHEPKKV